MKKLSKKQKQLQGTYEPSRDGLEPVKYDGCYERIPKPPDGWPVEAQAIWRDRCNDLKQTGYLTKAMLAPLRRYCFAVYQAEQAEKYLLTEGFTTTETGTEGQRYEVISKWVGVLDNANKTIEKFGAKFGFSPLDVQKIPVVEKDIVAEMSLFR